MYFGRILPDSGVIFVLFLAGKVASFQHQVEDPFHKKKLSSVFLGEHSINRAGISNDREVEQEWAYAATAESGQNSLHP